MKNREILKKLKEWKAKLDIATIEKNEKAIKEMFKPVDDAIEKTGETMSKMMEAYASLLSRMK